MEIRYKGASIRDFQNLLMNSLPSRHPDCPDHYQDLFFFLKQSITKTLTNSSCDTDSITEKIQCFADGSVNENKSTTTTSSVVSQ